MKPPKNWVEPYELNLDWEIASWVAKLNSINKEQNGYWVQGINPVLINMIKSIIRKQYTPEQLKIDIETFMNTEQNPVYWGKKELNYES
jgi:hypothetical protein